MAVFMGLYGPICTGLSIAIHRLKNQTFLPRQEVFLTSTELETNYVRYANNNPFPISNQVTEKFPFSIDELSNDFKLYEKSLD
ncbi:MAG: hypothetical protein AAF378_15990 [Cyanobacteria bacterium P01_A01_bin.84]